MKFFSGFPFAWLVVCSSVIALTGWWIDHAALASWLPGIANMTFNTALCFLLTAIACVIVDKGGDRKFAIWFSIAVGLFAALSLAEDLFGVGLGIDNLLFDARALATGATDPGRMSPNTAVGFMLTALVVLAMAAWDYWRKYTATVHALLLLLALIGLLGIAMNLLFSDVPKSYSHFASISLFTALSFLLLAAEMMSVFHRYLREAGDEQGVAYSWLYSTVQLMYRLKYPQKFALISLIFLLPITVLMWHEMEEADEHVQIAKLKLNGIRYIAMTDKLFRAVPEHRGMTNANFIDPSLFQAAMRSKMVEVDQLLAKNALLAQKLARKINIPPDLKEIASRWELIKYGDLGQQDRWRLHTEIIALLAKRLRYIGESTGLSREQDPTLHRLLDTHLVILPPLFEYVGQLRGLGVPYLAGNKISVNDTIRLGGLLGRIQMQARDLETVLQPVLEQRGMETMRRLYRRFVSDLQQFSITAEQQFSAAQQQRLSPESYFKQATAAIKQGGVLSTAILQQMEQRLQQRIYRQVTIQYNIKLAVLVLAVVLLILFISFYQSVIYTIRALEKSADKMRKGEMEGLLSLPTHDELGSIVNAFNSIARDLMQANAKVKAVIEHAVAAIITIDASGVINTFNPAAETMFGYECEQAIGSNIVALMPESYRAQHLQGLRRFAEQGHGGVVGNVIHVSGLRNNGEVFPLELLITSMEHEGERWFIGMLRDISEQESLEERLRHAQKMEAIGALVGGVAHNFNNMLAGIVGKAYLAKMKAKDNPAVVKNIEAIEGVAHDASEMVKQLLTFAQKDFYRDQREVALAPVVREGVRVAKGAMAEEIAFSLTIDAPDMVVNCDAQQIAQVLINLINNACDAVAKEDDKWIQVSLTRFIADDGFKERHSELARIDGYACLAVQDHGCGMDEALQAKIFEPFFTTKDVGEGAGLGLSSAYGTIASHRGAIEMESALGKGSVFRVYLPLVVEG